MLWYIHCTLYYSVNCIHSFLWHDTSRLFNFGAKYVEESLKAKDWSWRSFPAEKSYICERSPVVRPAKYFWWIFVSKQLYNCPVVCPGKYFWWILVSKQLSSCSPWDRFVWIFVSKPVVLHEKDPRRGYKGWDGLHLKIIMLSNRQQGELQSSSPLKQSYITNMTFFLSHFHTELEVLVLVFLGDWFIVRCDLEEFFFERFCKDWPTMWLVQGFCQLVLKTREEGQAHRAWASKQLDFPSISVLHILVIITYAVSTNIF